MNLIFNPGSDIPEPGKDDGWTNTYEEAVRIAREWLARMCAHGLGDIVLLEGKAFRPPVDGRWTFTYRHIVTGVEATLETHGIAPEDAFRKQNLFSPRQYWNGSSSSDPCLDDFTALGFVQTYRKVTG
jgi:hypothetical protein